MKSKIFALAVCLLFGTAVAFGQDKGTIKFKEDTHDFGKVKEEANSVSCVFEFTNTGKVPVILNNVAPSCGCTTPEWTKEPVLPGKTGKVTATYSTVGRPGVFNKVLTVYTNGDPETIVLTIKGEVEPKAQPQPQAQAPATK